MQSIQRRDRDLQKVISRPISSTTIPIQVNDVLLVHQMQQISELCSYISASIWGPALHSLFSRLQHWASQLRVIKDDNN